MSRIDRRFFVIGRHGEAPQKPDGGGSYDRILPHSIVDLYQQGSTLRYEVGEQGLILEDGLIVHTARVRTKISAKAHFAGVFNNKRKEFMHGTTTCAEDLDKTHYSWNRVSFQDDPRLNFGNPFGNRRIYNNGLGAADCVNYWLRHPTATTHEESEIEPGVSIEARTTTALRENLNKITSQDGKIKYLEIRSHSGVVDWPVMAIINSGLETKMDCVEQMGGAIQMGNTSILKIDRTEGGLYQASFELRGETYQVDLQNLLS